MNKMTPFLTQDHLVVGGIEDPFLPKLLQAINNATEIDIAVGFVKATGLTLLFAALQDALDAGAQVRFLTGDYLCVTDSVALRSLLVLKESGALIRIFESNGHSFHMKAYIFCKKLDGTLVEGRAFVGSSNISKSALKHGLEWNLRVECCENPKRFEELRLKFDRLFNDTRTKEITNSWIDAYVARIPQDKPMHKMQPEADEILPPPQHLITFNR